MTAPQDLAGLRLPGGTCRVEGYESLLLHDAVRSPRSPRPHPIWAFLAPQRGMGLTLTALFETLGCPLDTGPLLGTFAARRRRSRVLGVVDEVEVVLDLVRGDGAPVLTATYGFLLPRRDVPAPPQGPRTETAASAPTGPGHTGLGHAGEPLTVRAEEMKLMALLLRDPNPIHLDPDAAAALGFGRACVNQGPANLAYALGFLTARHPDAALVGFDARFRATVVAGDVVTPVAYDDGSFALRHADGRLAVTGHARWGRPVVSGTTPN